MSGGLQNLRRAALETWRTAGLPSRRDEAWKYTDVARLGVADLPLAETAESPASVPAAFGDSLQVVLCNGFLAALPAALPDGLSIGRLETATPVPADLGRLLPEGAKSFAAMNGALFTDGLVLRLAAGVTLERPVELVSLGQAGQGPLAFHPRLLVVLEAGASMVLVERHLGTGRYFSNGVSEIALGEGALLSHYLLQDAPAEAVHLSLAALELQSRASYQAVSVQLGAALSRLEILPVMAGEGASFSIDGAYVGHQHQHLDNTTFVVHRAPRCSSRQVFKGVLDDHARGVFQGSVLVERGAQKTDAHQLSKALLLSDNAEMDAKPELEIYADDVKCGHGATIGDIDESALFYLRARGIGEAEARQMLIDAFLAEVVDCILPEAVREGFAGALTRHLVTSKEAR